MNFPLVIKPNALAKRLKLKIDYIKRQVILVTPKNYSKKRALEFAEQNQAWIKDKTENFKDKIVFRENDEVEILGVKRKIVFVPSNRRSCQISESEIIINGDVDKIHKEIIKLAKGLLEKYLYEKSEFFAKALGVSFKDITVKVLRSRLGSCSSLKNLNFNLKLAFCPLFVVDMVVAHEITHLKEMNHGVNFKNILDRLYPKVYEADKWLKLNNKELNRISLEYSV